MFWNAGLNLAVFEANEEKLASFGARVYRLSKKPEGTYTKFGAKIDHIEPTVFMWPVADSQRGMSSTLLVF
jgi:hypothetical protein